MPGRDLAALLCALALLVGCGRDGSPAADAGSGAAAGASRGHWQSFPADFAAAMARGVNVSNWFQHRTDQQAVPGWPDTADFRHMRRLGLGHVRLLLDPDWLHRDPAHGRELRAGIEAALAEGLVVVLALQPEAELKRRLGVDGAEFEYLAQTWRGLAAMFADLPRDALVFEVLNEPEVEAVDLAHEIQVQLVRAARSAGPDRWAVISGAHFSDVDDLVALPAPVLDGVIYGFHFYEPHNFTHQGASWGWPMWALLRDLPYPSSPEALAPVLPGLAPQARDHAAWYGQQAWNRASLAPIIERAAAWADRHRVPIWCSEFGVLRDVTPPASRRAWLRDVHDLFEEHDIAWSHFDWWGHFGLVTGEPGARLEDADARVGLGLAADR